MSDSSVCSGCGCQHHRCACEWLNFDKNGQMIGLRTPDPNGAHALPTNDVCPKCHGELAHPDEMKMQLCYPCSAKAKHDSR